MGDLLYYLGIQCDITSQIKAEEEIKKLKESFAKESITKSTSELNIQTWSEFYRVVCIADIYQICPGKSL